MDSPLSTVDTTDRLRQIARRLEEMPNPAALRSLDDLAAPIEELRLALADLDALPPDRLDRDLRADVAERLRAFGDKRERLRLLTEAQTDLEDRLRSAADLFADSGAVDRVIVRYNDAIAAIGSLRQAGRNWDRVELETIERMQARVEAVSEVFRDDHERPTTRQEGEELTALIIQFHEMARKNPQHNVTYFNAPDRMSARPVQMEVSQALDIARLILFNLWDAKIETYLELARQKLEIDHEPRAARVEWERCNRLPGRDIPAVGLSLSTDQTRDINELKVRIEAAIEKLTDAEETLRRAENALEPPHPDPLEADKLRRKAEESFSHVGGLDRVRAAIVQAARTALPAALTAVETQLRAEAWPAAAAALQRAEGLLNLQPAGQATDERARLATWRAVYSAVEPLVAPAGGPPSLEEQRTILEELSRRYADDFWPGWPTLARQLTRLRTRRDVDALLAEANTLAQPDGHTPDLDDLLQRLRALEANPPADMPSESRPKLPETIRRVSAWLGYARLRDELAKVPADGAVGDASPLEDVADLKVAEHALAQTKQDFAAAMATQQSRQGRLSLARQLKKLQANDNDAGNILERATALLHRHTLPQAEEWRTQLDELRTILGRPNSLRQELLTVYGDARRRLAHLVAEDLTRQLDETRPHYYEPLDEKKLDAALNELQNLWPAGDPTVEPATRAARAALLAEAGLARTLARAHRIERDARRGILTWEKAQQAWETARAEAEDRSDIDDYAHHRTGLARKEVVFKEAASASTPIVAANMLRDLTDDEVLRHDWTVWFHHGRMLFESVRAAVAPEQTYDRNVEALSQARGQLETARRSLHRAQTLRGNRAPSQAEEGAWAYQLETLVDVLEQWDGLLRALSRYQENLRGEWPTHVECLRIAQTHQEIQEQLSAVILDPNAPSPAAAYEGLWKQVHGVAQGRLETRLHALANSRDDATLLQLDALLGQLILSPASDGAQSQLVGQANLILRALQTLVQDTIGDYSGANFSARFLRRTGQSPAPDSFLGQQIDEARQTAVSLATYDQTLQRARPTSFQHDPRLLATWVDQVNQWIDKLEQFNKALQNAERLAQDGLANPQQFDRANRILRAAQTTDTELTQIAPEFIRANHPAYRWIAARIAQDVDRRNKQETALNQIHQLIAREREGVALALRWKEGRTPLTPNQQEQVRQMINVLTQLRQALRDMVAAAPDDPTLLQSNLLYHLPEQPDELTQGTRGAANIERLIDGKIKQYRQVNQWLNEWLGPEPRYPVVDWERVRRDAMARRETGMEGLKSARRLCLLARDGAEDSRRFGEAWPLQPALVALSAANLRGVAHSAIGDTEVTGPDWYGVVEPLNQRRLEFCRQLETHLQDNERLREDIGRRMNQYQPLMDELQSRKQALFNTFHLPWQPWPQVAAYQAFLETMVAFCAVCPRLDVFQQMCQEVADYTRMGVRCPENDEGQP